MTTLFAWMRRTFGGPTKLGRCIECGRPLTHPEHEHYAGTCNACEGRAMQALDKQASPCCGESAACEEQCRPRFAALRGPAAPGRCLVVPGGGACRCCERGRDPHTCLYYSETPATPAQP